MLMLLLRDRECGFLAGSQGSGMRGRRDPCETDRCIGTGGLEGEVKGAQP
jgi:hypothetical protein